MRSHALIRAAGETDAVAIAGIYNPFVLDTHVTFETVPLSTTGMASRIRAGLDTGLPWLAAAEDNRVIAFAYAHPWKQRQAYRHTLESTIYVAPGHARQGVGMRLYAALLDQARAVGAHAIIAVIALPNAPSVGLHERMGFEKVAHFREVGHKLGRWVDVGYWQLMLE